MRDSITSISGGRPCANRSCPCRMVAAGEQTASLSCGDPVTGLFRRETKSSISRGRWPVRSSSPRARWFSERFAFARINQSLTTRAAQRWSIFAHSCFTWLVSGSLNEQSFSDHFGELLDFDWFHDDFVGLKNDHFHGTFHVGESAQQHRQSGWLGVPHFRDYGEAIPCFRYVHVGDQVISTSNFSVAIYFGASVTLPTATTSNPLDFRDWLIMPSTTSSPSTSRT